MAILKAITSENGITTNYHRIVSITSITNRTIKIEVASYISTEQREKEKNTPLGQPLNLYIFGDYINKDYTESYNIVDAYNYIKTLEKYQNSTDC